MTSRNPTSRVYSRVSKPPKQQPQKQQHARCYISQVKANESDLAPCDGKEIDVRDWTELFFRVPDVASAGVLDAVQDDNDTLELAERFRGCMSKTRSVFASVRQEGLRDALRLLLCVSTHISAMSADEDGHDEAHPTRNSEVDNNTNLGHSVRGEDDSTSRDAYTQRDCVKGASRSSSAAESTLLYRRRTNVTLPYDAVGHDVLLARRGVVWHAPAHVSSARMWSMLQRALQSADYCTPFFDHILPLHPAVRACMDAGIPVDAAAARTDCGGGGADCTCSGESAGACYRGRGAPRHTHPMSSSSSSSSSIISDGTSDDRSGSDAHDPSHWRHTDSTESSSARKKSAATKWHTSSTPTGELCGGCFGDAAACRWSTLTNTHSMAPASMWGSSLSADGVASHMLSEHDIIRGTLSSSAAAAAAAAVHPAPQLSRSRRGDGYGVAGGVFGFHREKSCSENDSHYYYHRFGGGKATTNEETPGNIRSNHDQNSLGKTNNSHIGDPHANSNTPYGDCCSRDGNSADGNSARDVSSEGAGPTPADLNDYDDVIREDYWLPMTRPASGSLYRALFDVTWAEQAMALRWIQGICLTAPHQRRCVTHTSAPLLLYYVADVCGAIRRRVWGVGVARDGATPTCSATLRDETTRVGTDTMNPVDEGMDTGATLYASCDKSTDDWATHNSNKDDHPTNKCSSSNMSHCNERVYTCCCRRRRCCTCTKNGSTGSNAKMAVANASAAVDSIDAGQVAVVAALMGAVEAACHYNPPCLVKLVQTGALRAMLELAHTHTVPTDVRAAVCDVLSVLLQETSAFGATGVATSGRTRSGEMEDDDNDATRPDEHGDDSGGGAVSCVKASCCAWDKVGRADAVLRAMREHAGVIDGSSYAHLYTRHSRDRDEVREHASSPSQRLHGERRGRRTLHSGTEESYHAAPSDGIEDRGQGIEDVAHQDDRVKDPLSFYMDRTSALRFERAVREWLSQRGRGHLYDALCALRAESAEEEKHQSAECGGCSVPDEPPPQQQQQHHQPTRCMFAGYEVRVRALIDAMDEVRTCV